MDGIMMGILLFLALNISQAADVVFVPKAQVDHQYRLPLVVMFHGCNTTANEFAAGTHMNDYAQAHGFAVFYPEQDLSRNVERCWNWFLPVNQVHGPFGEADFLMSRVRNVVANYGFDPTRVYVVGMSAGAGMAAILSSCFAYEIAGVAMHSGISYEAAFDTKSAKDTIEKGQTLSTELTASHAYQCSYFPRKTMPMIAFHGTADVRVHPTNLNSVTSHLLRFNDFMKDGALNGDVSLLPARETFVRGNPYMKDYIVTDYDSNFTVLARTVQVANMQHAWSGGDSRFPRNDMYAPSASHMIVDFFGL